MKYNNYSCNESNNILHKAVDFQTIIRKPFAKIDKCLVARNDKIIMSRKVLHLKLLCYSYLKYTYYAVKSIYVEDRKIYNINLAHFSVPKKIQ